MTSHLFWTVAAAGVVASLIAVLVLISLSHLAAGIFMVACFTFSFWALGYMMRETWRTRNGPQE